ncbi:MAG: ABC transporter permease [Planctomycetota bacterium]|jgi:ABC-type Na+ efflux pump permease subunit
MNKAYLVALREYLENLKTKTFWFGIMIFPLILILSILVPYWLEKKKDVRHFAVVDKSGWLLYEVEERAAMPDMKKLLAEALERYEKKSEDFAQLPEVLQALSTGLSHAIELRIQEEIGSEPPEDAPEAERETWDEEEEKIRWKTLDQTAELFKQFEGPEGQEIVKLIAAELPLMSGVDPQKVLDEFEAKVRAPIRTWWKELPAKEASKYASGLSKSRYARKEVDASDPEIETKLKDMLKNNELFAYFVISEDPVGMPASGLEMFGDTAKKGEEPEPGCKYVSNNLTDTDLKNWFSRYANAVISSRRIAKAEIGEATAKWIQQPLVFEAKQISAEGEEEEVGAADKVRQWAPAVFAYVLWISVFVIAQMLLTNTIEEKSNKIMEVLLSSVSPIQLMAGKILGIASTGLTMVLSWVLFFILCVKMMPLFLTEMPDLDLTLIIRDPIYLSSFIGYFIMGYLLLSAILVGIGSVCNSLKEAQNLMGPVTIIMIVPLLALAPIGQDPNGTIAKVMSYIPPFTPFVMMNRAAGPPSAMEYVVTTLLLVVSIAITLWAAAKVFRIGILMTGKPPKIMEILRWIKAPVGQVPDRRDE